jgi:hypothetical protein
MVDDDLATVAPWGLTLSRSVRGCCSCTVARIGSRPAPTPSGWQAGSRRQSCGCAPMTATSRSSTRLRPHGRKHPLASQTSLRRCTYMRLKGTLKAAWTRSQGCGLPVVSYSYGCTTSLPCRRAWGIAAWQDHDRRLPQQRPPGRPGSPLVGRPRATNRHPAGRPGRAGKWRPRRPWPSRIPSMRSPGK